MADTPRDADPRTGATPEDGPVFPVSEFVVEYAEPAGDLPPADVLLPERLALGTQPSGYVAPRRGLPTEEVALRGGPGPRRFHASAIAAVAAAVLERARERGLVGIYVMPHPEDIEAHSERDRRPPGRTRLRLQVHVGRVKELRSIASGGRITDEWKINNPAHRALRQQSPIQPTPQVGPDQTDLLRRDLLEDFLFRLNRHPGRRVEAALAASEDGSGIALDLHVHEARPWFVYAQSSDTGTEQTNAWQHRVGFVHRQLTGRDDILQLQYTNAGLDEVHAVHGAYEAPWFRGERPQWMRSQPDEAFWQRWLRRDAWPWWGSDRLRWRASGGWSRFDARDVEDVDDVEGEEWNAAASLVWQAFQHRDFFVDVVAGLRGRGVSVLNRTIGSTDPAQETFLLPEVGIEIERVDEVSALRGLLVFETNVLGTGPSINNLGRADVEDRWKLLRWDLGISQYLEPLLFPSAWKDPSTARSSTLAHEFAIGARGQTSFGDRLVPQTSQVVGGLFSVRGYEQSAAVGDTVFVGSAEYRFHLPRSLPLQREPLQVPLLGAFRAAPPQAYARPDWDLVLRGFFDIGKTIRYRGPSGTVGPIDEDDDLLLGVGVGVELQIKQNIVIRTDWGHALHDLDSTPGRNERGSNEFHFLFSVLY